jgi:hypothetical protein
MERRCADTVSGRSGNGVGRAADTGGASGSSASRADTMESGGVEEHACRAARQMNDGLVVEGKRRC